MNLTPSQDRAMAAFQDFRAGDGTVFGLYGGPGTGKSFLTARILEDMREPVVAAPTHKAINVTRRFLDGVDLDWEQGYDERFHAPGRIITGTTASLLGICPVITDDQGTEVKFGKGGRGMLDKMMPKWILIDEVSMLPLPHFRDLFERCRMAGTKIVIVGDKNQLPPVKAQPIPLDDMPEQATLTDVMRQRDGSKILDVAYAIVREEPWRHITGPGVTHSKNLLRDFLEDVKEPAGAPEEERAVYIAYRNVMVDMAQEAACQAVYGHGMKDFRPGELVVSECNLTANRVMAVANQDEIVIESISETQGDNEPGLYCTFRVRGRVHGAYYLPEEQANDQRSFYNVELKRRMEWAQELQQKVKKDRSVDGMRRQAWVDFFNWRDQTVIRFRHPFAMTAHKSQGSTVRAVYANATDLERYNRAALYVAVTRPKDRVVLG
jgi:exodeoxyribonuclease-5